MLNVTLGNSATGENTLLPSRASNKEILIQSLMVSNQFSSLLNIYIMTLHAFFSFNSFNTSKFADDTKTMSKGTSASQWQELQNNKIR